VGGSKYHFSLVTVGTGGTMSLKAVDMVDHGLNDSFRTTFDPSFDSTQMVGCALAGIWTVFSGVIYRSQ
jgi:hypothetical protein